MFHPNLQKCNLDETIETYLWSEAIEIFFVVLLFPTTFYLLVQNIFRNDFVFKFEGVYAIIVTSFVQLAFFSTYYWQRVDRYCPLMKTTFFSVNRWCFRGRERRTQDCLHK